MKESLRASSDKVIIQDAIKGRKLLQFTYDGFTRTVEPHTYGINVKGERALCAYQVAGGSHSSPGGWRNFSEANMSGIAVLDEKFPGPRKEYRRGDGFFRSIIAEL